jgi:hypothetical protein
MLRASYTYRSKVGHHGRGAGTYITEREMPRTVEELFAVVDRFGRMASDLDGRFPPGADGAHAWISIIDQGFVMHAYFNRRTIGFELYGPHPAGKEREYGDPYDGSGLCGELDEDALMWIITLLDQGRSPREYVQENAKKCSLVTD